MEKCEARALYRQVTRGHLVFNAAYLVQAQAATAALAPPSRLPRYRANTHTSSRAFRILRHSGSQSEPLLRRRKGWHYWMHYALATREVLTPNSVHWAPWDPARRAVSTHRAIWSCSMFLRISPAPHLHVDLEREPVSGRRARAAHDARSRRHLCLPPRLRIQVQAPAIQRDRRGMSCGVRSPVHYRGDPATVMARVRQLGLRCVRKEAEWRHRGTSHFDRSR